MTDKANKMLGKEIERVIGIMENTSVEVSMEDYNKLLAIARAEQSMMFPNESKKVENELRAREIAINEKRLKVEEDRLNFEQLCRIDEIKARENELKNQKANRITNIVLRVCELAIPVGFGFACFMISNRLVYVDDGRQPSDMRDLWKMIFKGK